MPSFFTTSSVRNSLDKYKKDNTYNKCCVDLCEFFKDKSLEEIFNLPRAFREQNRVKLIKSRVNCSNYNKGASHGYRVYYYVDMESRRVTLIAFYPKKGPNGKENLSKSEQKEAIDVFRLERDSAALVRHNPVNEFELMPA